MDTIIGLLRDGGTGAALLLAVYWIGGKLDKLTDSLAALREKVVEFMSRAAPLLLVALVLVLCTGCGLLGAGDYQPSVEACYTDESGRIYCVKVGGRFTIPSDATPEEKAKAEAVIAAESKGK